MQDDVEMFYDTTGLFASDEFKTVPFYANALPQAEDDAFGDGNVDVADARSRFLGPLTFFGKRAADTTWDFLNNLNTVSGDAQWVDQPGTQYAINCMDLGRPHTIVLTLEQNAGISYEVEIVRHFEIIPGEESPLEVQSATLSNMFSSPIDLIRKLKLEHALANPFAPLNISTTSTVWGLEPIIMANTKALKMI